MTAELNTPDIATSLTLSIPRTKQFKNPLIALLANNKRKSTG